MLQGFSSLFGAATVAYVSTNLDDLMLLLGFFSERRNRPFEVAIAQFFGMAIIIALSLFSSLIESYFFSSSWSCYLGLVPLLLGIYKIGEKRIRVKTNNPIKNNRSNILPMTLVFISNGGDNVAVTMSLFANYNRAEIFQTIAIYFVLTGLWCLVGYQMNANKKLQKILYRFFEPLLPYLLMALGIKILWPIL